MISQLAHIDPSARLGNNVTVHPFAFIDKGTVIGDNCVIMPYASIMEGSTLGSDVKVYQGAVVGADPQDFRWKGVPSHCRIGDKAIIREHVIINRGFISPEGTRIEENVVIMANSHVGHDSCIERNCVLGNGVTIAGGVNVGHGTILSSNVILHEGVRVGTLALIKGGCRISSNVPPFTIIAHNPSTYYGVNSYVLSKHAGYDDATIDDIAKAYRHIYQSSTSLFNALRRIEQDVDPGEARDKILSFIRSNEMRIVGERNLE